MQLHTPELASDEIDLLARLRGTRRQRRKEPPEPTGRLDARMGRAIGSWTYVAITAAANLLYIGINAALGDAAPDPFPFQFLDVMNGMIAGVVTPLILMAQEREADIDRERARREFAVNVKAELELDLLHAKLDQVLERVQAAPGRTNDARRGPAGDQGS